jgi:hypothetical protein
MPDEQTSQGNGVSRRRFLQTVGLSAAAAPLARPADAAQSESAGSDAVAILGPGPVGITLRVNNKPHKATIDPATTLLEALRAEMDLTAATAARAAAAPSWWTAS